MFGSGINFIVFASDSGDEVDLYARCRPRITGVGAKNNLTAVSCLSESPK